MVDGDRLVAAGAGRSLWPLREEGQLAPGHYGRGLPAVIEDVCGGSGINPLKEAQGVVALTVPYNFDPAPTCAVTKKSRLIRSISIRPQAAPANNSAICLS